MAVDELGIAFSVLNRVADVPEGSAAAKMGLLPNDEIIAAKLGFKDEAAQELFFGDATSLPSWEQDFLKQNWAYLAEIVTQRHSAFLNVTVKRGKNQVELELVPTESDKYYRLTRGIQTEAEKETYLASSWIASAKDAGRQVWFDGTKIFKILRQLGTGNVPLTALGGIGTIAVQAQMEASNGTSRLLLFLTLLSVNLAVLNFLPIPVLDGGHMVFLAWEGITGRPPNERVQESLTMVGALLLLSLMVFAFGMDIWRFANFM